MDRTIKRFIIIIVASFILNLSWEYSHAPLYISQALVDNYNQTLIRAAIGDMGIIFFFFLAISAIHKNLKWINTPRWFDYTLLFVFGLVFAIAIEYVNLGIGRWAYTPDMPTILGGDISPLVQLAITSLASLRIGLIRKINK